MTTFKDQYGFSLIELITIIAIAGVISIFALASFNASDDRIEYETAIQKLRGDVRLAQQSAMSEGKESRVYIDQSNNRYYLKWNDGTYIQNPLGGGDFVVQFGQGDLQAINITGTELTNGYLAFSTFGLPSDGGTPFEGNLNVVTINNAKKLLITSSTGFLSLEDL